MKLFLESRTGNQETASCHTVSKSAGQIPAPGTASPDPFPSTTTLESSQNNFHNTGTTDVNVSGVNVTEITKSVGNSSELNDATEITAIVKDSSEPVDNTEITETEKELPSSSDYRTKTHPDTDSEDDQPPGLITDHEENSIVEPNEVNNNRPVKMVTGLVWPPRNESSTQESPSGDEGSGSGHRFCQRAVNECRTATG